MVLSGPLFIRLPRGVGDGGLLCFGGTSMERRVFDCAFKAAGDGSEFEGYANVFHNIDSTQEIVAPGAFKDALPQFLKDGFIGGLNHDWQSPIGKPLDANEDARGLFVRGKISDTQAGRDHKILLTDGVIKKMSIGYRTAGSTELDAAEVTDYWERNEYEPSARDLERVTAGARLLTKINPLYEVSPVMVPANSLADITGVKIDDIETERDFERFLRDSGYSRREATAIALHGFKAIRQREAVSGLPQEAADGNAALFVQLQRLRARSLALGVQS